MQPPGEFVVCAWSQFALPAYTFLEAGVAAIIIPRVVNYNSNMPLARPTTCAGCGARCVKSPTMMDTAAYLVVDRIQIIRGWREVVVAIGCRDGAKQAFIEILAEPDCDDPNVLCLGCLRRRQRIALLWLAVGQQDDHLCCIA